MKPAKCGFCKADMGERWLRVSIENATATGIAPSNFCDPGCIMGALTLQGYKPKPLRLESFADQGGAGLKCNACLDETHAKCLVRSFTGPCCCQETSLQSPSNVGGGACVCGHPADHEPGYCSVGCRAPGCGIEEARDD